MADSSGGVAQYIVVAPRKFRSCFGHVHTLQIEEIRAGFVSCPDRYWSFSCLLAWDSISGTSGVKLEGYFCESCTRTETGINPGETDCVE